MTKASHQIAGNPMPPRKHKAGSVGLAAGPEVTILDPLGNLLRRGETGEIVLRGPTEMQGYVSNPEAEVALFRTTDPAGGIYPARLLGRENLIQGPVDVHDVPGDHLHMLFEPSVDLLVPVLRRRLQTARQRDSLASEGSVC